MGIYLNPDSSRFEEAVNSDIYIDKTGLLNYTNSVLHTMQKYICISRPRRFGKSIAANMLAAYYSRGCDARELFSQFEIAKSDTFEKHLNQYNTIFVNMQEMLSRSKNVQELVARFQKLIIRELKSEYPEVEYFDEDDLTLCMQDVYVQTKQTFVIIIDEWDCIFREYKTDREAQEKYLDFLRAWLKDQEYIALAYMTGILPIKKYGSHSALNMFSEYSMINPREMAEFFGFTEDEVRSLCAEYKRNFEEAQAWYDGYELMTMDGENPKIYAMYSPKSVVDAMLSGLFDNYWNQTETYEALKVYIQMNFDGLKDAIVRMLAGDRIQINTGTFSNDMTTFQNRDDVLTLLVHLGYLSYRWQDKTVSIPNKEVSQEYVNAISTMDWNEVIESVKDSKNLLEAMWTKDADAVAAGIDKAHKEISSLQYNNENSLACTINLAFYFAREYYTIIREFPSGKGFADLCFIPRKMHTDKPAAVIELKWDKSAEGAISQIKDRQYVEGLKEFQGNLLLVGVNYDKDTKKHTCMIEEFKVG